MFFKLTLYPDALISSPTLCCLCNKSVTFAFTVSCLTRTDLSNMYHNEISNTNSTHRRHFHLACNFFVFCLYVVVVVFIHIYKKVDTIELRQYKHDKRLYTYSFQAKKSHTVADYSETGLVQNILAVVIN